jgi:sugar lactone lactonase YvrE
LGALETKFGGLTGILPDSSGGMLVADNGNGRVRGIDASGVVTTVAGGFIGDGRLATSASVNVSEGLVLDAADNLYLADTYNYRVRKVDREGTITTFAGNGMTGFSGDGGPATSANLNFPYGVAVDKAGNVFFTEEWSASIRRVDQSGTITTFFQDPNYYFDLTTLVIDANSNFYVADSGNCVVRKIDQYGVATIVAGTEFVCGYSGDGGPATQAQLSYIYGVAVDGGGNLYVADADNNRIRRVDAAGVITTVAGNGNCDFTGDGGPATAAALCIPYGVAVDPAGNFYIADYNNVRVRQVDRTGIIRTIAGNGGGYSGDGGPPVHAGFDTLEAVATDNVGNVYVAEFGRVRKIAFPRSLYLHTNKKVLTLDYTSPTGKSATAQNSGALAFQGGNPWRALGTWNASAALTRGTLYELKDLHAWLGVAARQDRKTNFDLRAELYKNGALVALGETRCITGLSDDANLAREATVAFAPFPQVNWDGTTDVLSLKLLTRIGTTANESACGGNAKASGLRLLFDAAKRPTQFPVTIP